MQSLGMIIMIIIELQKHKNGFFGTVGINSNAEPFNEVLRVELEVLHEKSSTSEGVDTEEDKLKECDAGNEPRWRPPHDLLSLLHHIKIVQQLVLPAKMS